MAGAITAAASDKAARFLQLCDAFGLPIVSLVDCPGYMVGPAAEAEALVRRASRMLVAGAALRVPLVAVVLRRGYGLGAQAMVGGSLHEPLLTVAWPGAHLGPMGLEGAVRLGLRKELEQIADGFLRETLPEWFAHERRPAFWRECMTTCTALAVCHHATGGLSLGVDTVPDGPRRGAGLSGHKTGHGRSEEKEARQRYVRR